MRVCMSCKETKGLKSIFAEDCDCHVDRPLSQVHLDINHSICKSCFFEGGYALEMDGADANEALTDSEHPDHKKAKDLFDNWDNYNYYWQSKKSSEDSKK